MDTKYILIFCTLATKLVLQSITTSKMYINAQDEKRCQYLLCEIKTNHVFFYLFYVIFMCSWHGRNQRDFSCGCAWTGSIIVKSMHCDGYVAVSLLI